MISKTNANFTSDVAWMVESLLQRNAFALFSLKQCIMKQLIDLVFVISSQGLSTTKSL